ncbi:MAG: fatty acid-binding protein DegV [Pseudonocardiales bacterium]|nr:DegV family protein [Actinomycetota bacterium]PZS22423.1 MAG: fatty acid-binding protein DegV [Pseudonocardiales bacterium]
MAVAVVTDSTAYFPAGLASRRGIRQVPLHVLVDGRHWLDGVQLGPAELVKALARRASVSTSRPTPGEFEAVYAEAIRAGADTIVSVHMSRALSGTWESARLAAEQFGLKRVRVVDSRSTGMGLGFSVLAAAAVAADGGDLDAVYDTAERVGASCRAFFSVDTLEYLRRGGRIGSAAARVGSALSVKPLLHVDGGRVVPLEKVRTASRARARLVDLAAQAAGSAPVDLAVHHLGAAERAADLVTQLQARLPMLSECLVSEVGAAIGAHAGPGMLGVVVLPGGLKAAV